MMMKKDDDDDDDDADWESCVWQTKAGENTYNRIFLTNFVAAFP